MSNSQVIEIIASHPEHDIIIGIDSLGKEDLLLQISHCLKTKVCSSDRLLLFGSNFNWKAQIMLKLYLILH